MRTGLKTLALTALVPLTVTTAPARADSDELERLLEDESRVGAFGGWADKLAERRPTYPYFEHHGSFRFRADFFHNGHLGTVVPGVAGSGSSNMPAPIQENAANNDNTNNPLSEGAKTLSSANIRLRYSPTLHISEAMRIKATVDILDNLVLGSTSDYAFGRPDAPLSVLSTSQASPSDGRNGTRDAVRIKEAYGEFHPSFLLRLGRQADHWGLGIHANAGKSRSNYFGYDDDHGDYVDRALLGFKLYGIYLGASWDFVSAGALDNPSGYAYGQIRDLGGADDVNQWAFWIGQQPISEREQTRRRSQLYERFKPTFDWGLYTTYRTQKFDLDATSQAQAATGNYDSLRLVPRDAWLLTPDLWLRYEQRFNFYSGLRIELEFVSVLGEIGSLADIDGNTEPRDIQQFGAALETQFDLRQWSMGLDAGFASGDSAGYGNRLASGNNAPNLKLSNYSFDRDYHIDLLLFREVIGSVSNTVYVKPWVAYSLFDSPEDTLGLRLDFLFAQALVPEATPGNSGFLGFETDLRLYFHTKTGFMFDLEAGLLLPGGALDYRPADSNNERDASLAFTLQSRFTITF